MLNLPNITTAQQQLNFAYLFFSIKQPPNIDCLINKTDRLDITLKDSFSHCLYVIKIDLGNSFNFSLLPKFQDDFR